MTLATVTFDPAFLQVVPKEPDEAMHVAAVKTIQRCTGNDDFPRRVYAAMLAAAPSATIATQEPVRGAFFNTGGGVTLCQSGAEEQSFGFASRLYTAPPAQPAGSELPVLDAMTVMHLLQCDGWRYFGNSAVFDSVQTILAASRQAPHDWTFQWDKHASAYKLESKKWGGTFLNEPEPHDISLPALVFRLARDLLQPQQGMPVDPSHEWPVFDRILTKAYQAGMDGDELDLIACRRAMMKGGAA